MYSDYSEADTERARRSEGAVTQPLRPTQLTRTSSAAGRRPIAIALFLVVFGLLLLARFFFNSSIIDPLALDSFLPNQGEIQAGLILLTIGSCFLFFAFWRRIYALSIPGCILTGLSAGVAFAALTKGVSVMWGLSFGFLAILLLGRSLFGFRRPWVYWPIFPATPLFIIGMIIAVSNFNLPFMFSGWFFALPVALISAGLYLGWGRRS